MSSFRPNPLEGGSRRGGFTPNMLAGLTAWYKASSLVSDAIDPGSLSGVVARYRADSITGAAPNTISGCTGWFRADLGVTLNGSKVSKWADQSGNGHDLIQNTGATQPTFVSSAADFNNKPAISFNNTLLASASGWSVGPNTSVVIIGEDDGTHAGYCGTVDNNIWFLVVHTGKYSAAGAAFFDSTVSPSANTPRFFALTNDISNNGKWYINSGVVNASGATNTTANTSGLVIGAQDGAGDGPLIGKIVEVAVFNRVLTAAEVADIQNYASIRYNIAVTNTVHAWNDTISGDVTHNFIQNTPANAPTLSLSGYNSQPSLSFTAANSQRMVTGTWTTPLNTTRTCIVVGNFADYSANHYFIDGLSTNFNVVYNDFGGGKQVGMYAGSVVAGSDDVSGTPLIAIAEFNGASSTLYSNSNVAIGTGDIGAGVLAGLTLGSSATSTAFLSGQIAEIVVFNRTLTTVEISGIQAYAAARYGLTLKVGAWADQATPHDATHDVAQITYSKQPTLNIADASFSNQPTLSFVAANTQALQSSSWSGSPSQPQTVFIVGKDGGAGQAYIDGLSFSSSSVFTFGSTYTLYCGDVLGSGVNTTQVPVVLGAILDNVAGAIFVSAKTAKATGSAGGNSISGLTIGSDGGLVSRPLDGKIAEVIVYSRALSQSEVEQVLTFLGNKYSITLGA